MAGSNAPLGSPENPIEIEILPENADWIHLVDQARPRLPLEAEEAAAGVLGKPAKAGPASGIVEGKEATDASKESQGEHDDHGHDTEDGPLEGGG